MLPSSSAILEAMTDAFLSLDAEGQVGYINAHAERLLRLDREEVLDCSLWSALPDWVGGDLHKAVGDALQYLQEHQVDQFHAATQRWFGMRLVPQQQGVHIYFNDVTDKKRARRAREQVHTSLKDQVRVHTSKLERLNEKLLFDSLHDALTGLPNRTYLMDTLRRAMNDSKHAHTVLFLDFDGFKLINDSLGHTVGDELLIALSQRLKHGVRGTELVARLGGDEFTIVLSEPQSLEAVMAVVERLQKQIAQPFQVRDYRLHLTASTGVVFDVSGYKTPEDVLRDADIAMYRAKTLGKGGYALFDKALHQEVMNRLTLESDLRSAIGNGELRVNYQPIVDVQTLEPVALETLVRWQHPTRGLVPPNEFVPVAEDSGLITDIDMWVVREACGQLQRWQRQFQTSRTLRLNVNFSGRHFAKPTSANELATIFRDSGFGADRLNIEITETVLMDDTTHTQQTLQKLRALGVRLQIDDFGTGYSSLSYLQRFSAHGLKIDRSFIDRLSEPKGAELVHALIHMAHSLDLHVTAEGVETAQQLATLRVLGCDYAQGYYFSKPLLPDKMFDFLQKGGLAKVEVKV